ncbi:hypothetical protein M404DRAFT_999918 [Pisolithus tinctorius Marx 270]|uniref:Uncharacterized protein n=1 Tax=Pisolithus tinctorius Marx 270 TaxID=870435 RepID=A0A0C3J8E6_PISTI|nr:hypothetical protein M404DRAFT_999918 [Pisolithus tinctorius Marx 270]
MSNIKKRYSICAASSLRESTNVAPSMYIVESAGVKTDIIGWSSAVLVSARLLGQPKQVLHTRLRLLLGVVSDCVAV